MTNCIAPCAKYVLLLWKQPRGGGLATCTHMTTTALGHSRGLNLVNWTWHVGALSIYSIFVVLLLQSASAAVASQS